MIGGAIKLGIAAGVGYTLGGKIGERALSLVTETADISTHTGAVWGGRIATTLALMWLLGRV